MEKSAFVRVFGDSPMVRVIDFLLTERGLYDYTLKDIAENSNVSFVTLQGIFPKLEKIGIVKMTRRIGKAKLHMLNEENLLVQKLIRLDKEISDYFIERELKKRTVEKPIKVR